MTFVVQSKKSTGLRANEHPFAGLFDCGHTHAFQTQECPTATFRLFRASIRRYCERTIAAGCNASDKGNCGNHARNHHLPPVLLTVGSYFYDALHVQSLSLRPVRHNAAVCCLYRPCSNRDWAASRAFLVKSCISRTGRQGWSWSRSWTPGIGSDRRRAKAAFAEASAGGLIPGVAGGPPGVASDEGAAQRPAPASSPADAAPRVRTREQGLRRRSCPPSHRPNPSGPLSRGPAPYAGSTRPA
jgi:hypothetical protein